MNFGEKGGKRRGRESTVPPRGHAKNVTVYG